MLRVYLIPPGMTDYSSSGELLGLNNPPLSLAGVDQAEKISLELKPLVLEAVISGPMKRHMVTAKIISSSHNLPVRTDKNLRDLNYGRWSGKNFESLLRDEPRLMAKLQSSPGRFKFPAGERVRRGWRRVREFTYQFRLNFGVGNVAIVCDDFVAMMVASQLTRVRFSDLEPWKSSNGEMTVLSMENDRWQIEILRGTKPDVPLTRA
jgi:broad specificity phosphatase PhoE